MLVSASPMTGASPQVNKLTKAPLHTLVEEQQVREMKPLLQQMSNDVSDRWIKRFLL